MADALPKAEEFENNAYIFEKNAMNKLNGWGLFGSNYTNAADQFDKAANSFKLAKSWDKAGSAYQKVATCLVKLERKEKAAEAYVDAAHCYKSTKINEAVYSLNKAVNLFCDTGRLLMAARYLKEIAELYESEQKIEQAAVYYEKSADFFQKEKETPSVNQCRQKVAQFSAQLEQYQKSIEIYEERARESVNDNSLYRVKGHLLNAGICELCKGDVVAIGNALERYQELDPTFSETYEYTLLADVAAAVEEDDVGMFTDAVKEYEYMIPLDSWQMTLLLRVKEKLKSKEVSCCVCTTMPSILKPPRNTICESCCEGVRSIISMMNGVDSEKAKAITNPNGSSVSRKNLSQTFNQQKEDLIFLRDFAIAFKRQIHTDILITPGKQGPPIPAHKSVLAARSEIFRNMLECDECKAPPSNTIILPDLNHEELKSLLEFLYSGTLDPEKLEKHVYALSQAADAYMIPHLLKQCERYLLSSLSTSNAIETLEIADTCSNHLKETTLNFLVNNIEHMVSSPKFEAFVHKSPHLTVQLFTKLFVGEVK